MEGTMVTKLVTQNFNWETDYSTKLSACYEKVRWDTCSCLSNYQYLIFTSISIAVAYIYKVGIILEDNITQFIILTLENEFRILKHS